MSNRWSTEVSFKKWLHDSLVFSQKLCERGTEPLVCVFFPFRFVTSRSAKKCNQYSYLGFRSHFFHNHELDFFHQRFKQHVFTWGGLFTGKLIDFYVCVAILIVQKCQKIILLLPYLWIQILTSPYFCLDFFHHGFEEKFFICEKVFELIFFHFCTIIRFFIIGRKFWKVFLSIFKLTIFKSFSAIQHCLRKSNTILSSLSIVRKYKLNIRTRKERLEFFWWRLNRKPLVFCSINHFFNTLRKISE